MSVRLSHVEIRPDQRDENRVKYIVDELVHDLQALVDIGE
jgi:hypothetical protein